MVCGPRRSGQRPGVFLQQVPGFVAHLLLNVGIEPDLPQRLLDGLVSGLLKVSPPLVIFSISVLSICRQSARSASAVALKCL
jgi:hypothetical protein